MTKARASLASLVREAEDGHPVELTRHGRTVAVITSHEEFARLVAGKTDFISFVDAFRASHDLEKLDIDPGLFSSKDRKQRLDRGFEW